MFQWVRSLKSLLSSLKSLDEVSSVAEKRIRELAEELAKRAEEARGEILDAEFEKISVVRLIGTTTSLPAPTTEAKPMKRRGRPPKSAVAVSAQQPVAKKRGRPAKR